MLTRHLHPVILPTGAFLLLVLGVMGLNVLMSQGMHQDALEINLAGRQRMLSQRMAKELLLLQADPASRAAEHRASLMQSLQLFDETLAAFRQGGLVHDATGGLRRIEALRGERIQDLLRDSALDWQAYRRMLKTALAEPAAIQQMVLNSQAQNTALLARMNQLTQLLEEQAETRLQLLQTVQQVALALSLLLFGGILRALRCEVRTMRDNKALLRAVLDNIETGVLTLNGAGRVLSANAAAAQLFERSPEQLQDCLLRDLLAAPYYPFYLHRANGDLLPVDISLSAVTAQHYVASLRDLSQQHLQQEELMRIAYQDPLTQLPNRLLFEDRLEQEIHHARRNGHCLGLFFLDLDGFKPINDQFGHACGDLVLQTVARRLRDALREGDTVARLGGDEFVLIAVGIHNVADCVRIARKLLRTIKREIYYEGQLLQVSASIGISVFPHDAEDRETLLRRADEAMYVAKSDALGFRFYDKAGFPQCGSESHWAAALRERRQG
ncbi:MAG: diguanylate cyclase [Pseudomonadota bacterium]